MFNSFKSALGTIMIISAAITGFTFAGAHAASAASNGQTTTATVGLTIPDGAAVGIKSAPNLDFGTGSTSTTDKTYNATNTSAALVVSNPGLNTTWYVNVTASDFVNEDGRTMQGAQIELGEGSVKADAENNVSNLPSTNGSLTVAAGGDAVNVMKPSTDGASVGDFTDEFASDQIKLNVPGGNVAGSYSADLVWELSDTPAASQNA